MKNITFQNLAFTRELFGHHNTNLDKISQVFNVEIHTRGNSILDDVVRHKLVSNSIDAYEKK
jgi:phosphate starvation-inducible PhoH-like protein